MFCLTEVLHTSVSVVSTWHITAASGWHGRNWFRHWHANRSGCCFFWSCFLLSGRFFLCCFFWSCFLFWRSFFPGSFLRSFFLSRSFLLRGFFLTGFFSFLNGFF